MDNLIRGLQILRTYDEDAPIVTFPYGVAVPAVLTSAVSPEDTTTLTDADWQVHPVWDCYWYRVATLTELGNVTGPPDVKTPILDIPEIGE